MELGVNGGGVVGWRWWYGKGSGGVEVGAGTGLRRAAPGCGGGCAGVGDGGVRHNCVADMPARWGRASAPAAAECGGVGAAGDPSKENKLPDVGADHGVGNGVQRSGGLYQKSAVAREHARAHRYAPICTDTHRYAPHTCATGIQRYQNYRGGGDSAHVRIKNPHFQAKFPRNIHGVEGGCG